MKMYVIKIAGKKLKLIDLVELMYFKALTLNLLHCFIF